MAGNRPDYHRHSKRVTSTKRWNVLRMYILERDGFRCKECGKGGRLEVDHIKPVRSHPTLAYSPGNLQALCPSCHTKKTRIECGHPPPRNCQQWQEAIEALSRPGERSIITKDIKDA
ncbi:HNH endonuclease signature motif containing protein [uncultured Sulfitobacter sp.]|uniref:HNH endonuclease n=1 Tax=uncultured Sulfitobacter sp. TaxID=191468 RepID=UPI0030D8E7BE|tara:strand:- start:22365 stop:22715 length:351 start_codon:yes stop_codon:yes gene_type:complete